LEIQIASLIITALGIVIALPYGIDGIAYAIVGASAFSGLFMLRLALRCLKAKWRESLRALVPAAILNALLAFTLYMLEQFVPPEWLAHDFVNIAIMGMVGGLIYAGALLYFPIPALAAERLRWKSKLRLSHNAQP
jgi:peptidoglycan biosynthesis protein MviN/MurJ (putative lipid II flippase)